jgi:hypothetical protein
MASGGSSSGSGQSSTGQTTSLSFVPALLANAFFGSGIGLSKGGFTSTGLGDFTAAGKMKGGRSSSLVDPFGLGQIVGSNPLLEGSNPFSSFAGDGNGDYLSGLFGGVSNQGGGGDDPLNLISPEDQAFGLTNRALGFSTEASGLGQGGALNPMGLLSNIMDLTNPNINPGLQGALRGLQSGELGQLAGNSLLFGEGGVGDIFKEGLNTGFKPDLQPIIDEASRAFFQDIVPQLGQQNVALQEGVGPFSTDLSGQLTGAGATLASQLGSLEVENQNRAADRRGEFLGISPLITDQLMNSGVNAGRNILDLGEQFAMQGTTGGRQATLLQLLAGMTPSGPIQSSQSSNQSKSGQGGILA